MRNRRIIHGTTKPTGLRKGREAKQCRRCNVWFSAPSSEIARQVHCSDSCAPGRTSSFDSRITKRRREDEAWARSLGYDAATGEVML